MKSVIVIFCCFQIILSELDQTWWRNTIIYEVYLPSFKDSNGDGIGDLKGLTSKLDHFVELGVKTVYITPHYLSPMEDGGYDITNFTEINPMFGTMENFEELVRETEARSLKLLIDVVINHSSDKHPWFLNSVQRIDPYTDFYVWRNASGFNSKGKPMPPNNWVSIFGGSAWQWHKEREQFYLHQFNKNQPDFNLRNKVVKKEMKKIFKFWLDKGVSGFRLDATKYLIEDDKFLDEPKIPHHPLNRNLRIYTEDLWESYQLLHEFRKFCDRVTKKFKDYERIYLPEAYTRGKELYQYYGTRDYKIAHFPLNFAFVLVWHYQNATFFHNLINDYLKNMPEGAMPCWNSENHDKWRKAMLFNAEYEYIFTTLVMLLPGVAYVYYGQEIGMVGSRIRPDQEIDVNPDDLTGTTRDAYRSPMQWDNSLNAGFSNSLKTYLPVSSEYHRINLKNQKKNNDSHYHIFKRMVNLRKTDVFQLGGFESYVVSRWVYAFRRFLKGHDTYVIIVNLGSETEVVSLSNSISDLPEFLTVEFGSPNCGYESGNKVQTSSSLLSLVLRPFAVIVLHS